ncbi:GntR family transcriptional regulator [Nocardioides halotolerans]|uniref:GntR family transcriptional regulator n=1 Tax=Nocardioides halotolerans TaxID=433660 RepID=UPI00041E3CAA|nr:GntR family transcriptional regulator [Nocardioides halotolerans]
MDENADAGGSLSGLALLVDGKPPTRGDMPNAVANALREAILNGSLGPGRWLREAEVAREMNVSRTPVRDAFRILAAERLVEMKANQGVVVSQMSSEDVLELYVVREALEGLAARLAARHGQRQCLDAFTTLIPEMRRVGEAGEVRELSRLNFEFHAVVRDSGGNRYLAQLLTQLQQAARRFPDPTLGLPGRIEESIDEHVKLADAISQGDADTAEKIAVDHMRHLAELRIRMLLRN